MVAIGRSMKGSEKFSGILPALKERIATGSVVAADDSSLELAASPVVTPRP
jgi:hypothetical protein